MRTCKMDKEETPISKYLASLERRQAMLTPSPQLNSADIIRRINFEDDTFLQCPAEQSYLHVSPADAALASDNRPLKRRRLSVLGELMEDEENQCQRLSMDFIVTSELERLLQQTQGELIESRAMNSKLEHQIIEIKRANAERIVGYERSENEMRARVRDANEQAESFKEQYNKLSRKEDEMSERLHKQTEVHLEKVSALEARVRILETENLELKGKFESGSLRQSDELRKLSANLEETEMGAEKWIMETQLLRDQLELKEKQLQKYQNELREAQPAICKYTEFKARYDQPKSPGVTPENLEEKMKYFENLYVKQQSENLRLVRKMEKTEDENRMLRSTMNKELLLEEQISTFEGEVRLLRTELGSKAAVEAEKGTLQSELSCWKTMAFKLDPDCTNSTKFEAYIRKIQNQLLEAMHETSTLKHVISDRERNIAKTQSEAAALRDQVKSLTTDKENLSQEVKKVIRRLSLVTKDRDGLKALKESYEQEYEGQISKPLQERITQLEATVAEYEALIQEDPSSKKSCGECEKRMALISEIRNEIDRLKREKAEAEAQLANITQAGPSDDGNTTGIKVVSFGMNPSALTLESRLKEATKEIEDLKNKINELETQAEGKVPVGKEKELQDKNAQLERRLQILSEAYDFETQQLQLVVNKLCGFHFTFVREPNVQIRLSSIYSHEANDIFIFQESPNGDMLLLESPILDNFRDDIDRFLLREGSIPGFLASVTITYVQSQQDASHLPVSQQSVQSVEETATTTMAIHNPREVEVEVQRQRHAAVDEDEDEEEEHEDEDDERDGGEMDEEDM
ncbi:Mitotic spindle assembly checkpoint protein MAD1 [Orchesella cincta]|uniref:Mitotic spindle assembly checkpoint protein MAD1 n=1 Tax=Orchesella cincta TaxID=48709 RepID=A0A1D2MDR3_ORCCI|nr:Mitotic spindle assembly checkpoint protein MAD1 [Orchesella cincta]